MNTFYLKRPKKQQGEIPFKITLRDFSSLETGFVFGTISALPDFRRSTQSSNGFYILSIQPEDMD